MKSGVISIVLLFQSVSSWCQVGDYNWIQNIIYDGSSTPVTVGDTRVYFDLMGGTLQTQTWNLTRGHILASEEIRDRYNRRIGQTLAAPILPKSFIFQPLFLTAEDATVYDWNDFDNPVLGTIKLPRPVGNQGEGSLGWYYSAYNTLEPNTPRTKYPYSRTEFYDDGTGEVKRTALAGDLHRLGSGHEITSGVFPVFDELNDYLSRLQIIAPYRVSVSSLSNNTTQNVVIDQNGRIAINFFDRDGRSIMTASPGKADDHMLKIENMAKVASYIDSETQTIRRILYFYLLEDSPVQVVASTPSIVLVENILTGETRSANLAVEDISGTWLKGFYRVVVPTENASLAIKYTNYLTDVSYNFYNDAGKLISTVSPNGLQQWKAEVAYAEIDHTEFTYNFKGLLLSMKETDAGTAQYKYRKDGNIRFSQNALQASNEIAGVNGRFSYTLYDGLGRPTESGEYIGTAYTFSALGEQLEYGKQVAFERAVTKDWIKTYYDYSAPSIPNLASSFVQGFVRGSVSSTENANIQTWYSYDELGRVTWMAQKPKLLNKTFITQYSYDFMGNVLTVYNAAYIDGQPTDGFFHHYEYDKDKRLSKAYTSTDGEHTKLRATYEYYLHGPLKRIVLGDQLQGIDFIYNIQGWLTQINHPDVAQDPGKDGNDVFGMVLDYYESALNLSPTAKAGSPLDQFRIHDLPDGPKSLLANHQPLPRFTSFMDTPPDAPGSSFKTFSAENPRYKELLRQAHSSFNR